MKLTPLEEAEKNQEFQKSVISLQQAVLEGKPLETPISELVRCGVCVLSLEEAEFE